MTVPNLIDFLNNINLPNGNRDILDNEDAMKAYSPFVINRGLAQHKSTILYAQEMNKNVVVDPTLHHAFLFNAVSKTKRWAKWSKKEAISEDILLIQQVYQVNQERAAEYAKLLSPEDISYLKETRETGGQLKRGQK